MKLSEIYEGIIVHVVGGFKEYICEIGDHPLKGAWKRLKNPCMMFVMESDKGNPPLIKLQRMTDSKVYLDYLDTFMPDASFEIRPLDERGFLCKAYRKELERPDADLIVTPSDPDFGRTLSNIADFKRGQQKGKRRKR